MHNAHLLVICHAIRKNLQFSPQSIVSKKMTASDTTYTYKLLKIVHNVWMKKFLNGHRPI